MDEKTYAKLSAPFRGESASRLLRTADKALTSAFYVLYPLLITLLALGVDVPTPSSPPTNMAAGPEAGSAPFHPLLLPCIIVPGVGFALVSLIRKAINAPRPYEALSISPILIKDTKGQSLPSKHVFSSFCIAMCWLAYCLPAGCALLICACGIALIRVVGGVHWPRDVLAAALVGLLCGLAVLVW